MKDSFGYLILISLENLSHFPKLNMDDLVDVAVRLTWSIFYYERLVLMEDFKKYTNTNKVINNVIFGSISSVGYLLKTKDPKHLEDIKGYGEMLYKEFYSIWKDD